MTLITNEGIKSAVSLLGAFLLEPIFLYIYALMQRWHKPISQVLNKKMQGAILSISPD